MTRQVPPSTVAWHTMATVLAEELEEMKTMEGLPAEEKAEQLRLRGTPMESAKTRSRGRQELRDPLRVTAKSTKTAPAQLLEL